MDWDAVTEVATPDNKTHFTVHGLQPFTVYSFRVTAVSSLGTSFPSKESYYTVTLREVPDGKPTITHAGNASSTSVYLTWSPPPRSQIHGEFLGYKLKYWPRDKSTPQSTRDLVIRDPDLRVSFPA